MPKIKCAFADCKNSYTHIRAWQSTMCRKHNTKCGQEGCTCPPPFRWHCFPVNQQLREEWAKAVNRFDVNGKLWQPHKHDRVCSVCFENIIVKREIDSPVTRRNTDEARRTSRRVVVKKPQTYVLVVPQSSHPEPQNSAPSFSELELEMGRNDSTKVPFPEKFHTCMVDDAYLTASKYRLPVSSSRPSRSSRDLTLPVLVDHGGTMVNDSESTPSKHIVPRSSTVPSGSSFELSKTDLGDHDYCKGTSNLRRKMINKWLVQTAITQDRTKEHKVA